MKYQRGVPSEIYNAPRCMRQLGFKKINPPYKGWDDWLLAAEVVADYGDKSLARDGSINFWTMSGQDLIRAAEKILIYGLQDNGEPAIQRRYARK